MKIDNISTISNNVLCSGCGGCAGICSQNAIEMITNTAGYLFASIKLDLCINCKKCVKICSSNPENKFLIDTDDIFHGKCLSGYVGYANDKKIRQISQSGGIVTALLCYLLDKNKIDGAIVNNFNPQTRRPKVIVATSKQEIIDSSGSYYAQSPVVKSILENSDKKTAAVVLGCQAESLHLIREKHPNTQLPDYTIGLICSGQYSGHKIDDLVLESGCEEQISRFRFKDKDNEVGWPGDVHISAPTKDYWLPMNRRLELKKVYEMYRCMACYDQMNIFCDIVCGDPWGISHKQQPEGHTVVIARTEKGKKLLENAAIDGAIVIEELSVEDIIRGQTVDGRHKTKFYTSLEIFKENKWLFPFSENYFSKIKYTPANKKDKQQLSERLSYARDLYLTKDREDYLRKIRFKKKKLEGNLVQKLKRRIMRIGRFILRRFKIK